MGRGDIRVMNCQSSPKRLNFSILKKKKRVFKLYAESQKLRTSPQIM